VSAAGDSRAKGWLVLIEPHAAGRGGHWSKALPLLAGAARAANRRCVVVGAGGVDPELRAELQRRGAEVVERPPAILGSAAALIGAGRLLERLYRLLQPRLSQRLLPYQLQQLARCLIEAGSLRIAESIVGPAEATAVVLTASETLPALTTALGGMPHVRYVHEVTAAESRPMRLVERLLRPMLRHTAAVCPTASIARDLRARHPTLSCSTQTFALLDPDVYASEQERQAARAELALAPSSPVGSVVGGWWRAKDPTTLMLALPSVAAPFVLLVAGYRMEPRLLERMRAAHRGEMRVIDRQLTAEELGQVYAASDFTIVSRHANGKESGVAFDAVSHGIALIVSDHEDRLAAALRDKPWARVFRSGDADALAAALSDASRHGLPAPPRAAPRELGMLDGSEMLSFLDRVAPAAWSDNG
jgi:hypothetical protein